VTVVLPVSQIRRRVRPAGGFFFLIRSLGIYYGRVIFGRLRLWIDPVKRSGPEAMAVDEWLLATAEMPVLRVYGWLGAWGSVGYFGNLADAQSAFPGLEWVRRWTGGGTVDHRADWTYTVVAPAGETLADARGAESYRLLHAALAEALADEGIAARLSSGAAETGAAACFENPVSHDIVDAAGRKIAGAGQRRTKHGLLHQGSVAAVCDAARLAASLAENWETHEFHPPAEVISVKVRGRYALAAWTARR
jgi:lipoate-protein ligase A